MNSSTENPLLTWSAVLLVLGGALMVGGLVAVVVAHNPRRERTFYWATWFMGGGVGSLSLVPRGIGLALAGYAALVFVAVVYAFFRTNYIKIRGRIIAATPADRRPDPDS